MLGFCYFFDFKIISPFFKWLPQEKKMNTFFYPDKQEIPTEWA